MYLSEASISDMLSSHFQQPVAETLERISPDILQLEQYMDFERNLQFRETLLVHDSVEPKRALTPAVLHGLLMSSRAVAETTPVDLSAGAPVAFWNGKLGAEVLKLANGVRTRRDLLEGLMTRVARREIELEENGNPVTAPEAA